MLRRNDGYHTVIAAKIEIPRSFVDATDEAVKFPRDVHVSTAATVNLRLGNPLDPGGSAKIQENNAIHLVTKRPKLGVYAICSDEDRLSLSLDRDSKDGKRTTCLAHSARDKIPPLPTSRVEHGFCNVQMGSDRSQWYCELDIQLRGMANIPQCIEGCIFEGQGRWLGSGFRAPSNGRRDGQNEG